jgi:hypothetical protein
VKPDPELDAATGWPSGGVRDANLKAWLAAVAAVRPGSGFRDPMQFQSASMRIHAPSPAPRAEFAAGIARRKRVRQPSAAAVVAV